MLPDMEQLRCVVQERLSRRRYEHSLAVRDRAIELAGIYGYDPCRAGIAGLIHDICKEMDGEAQLNYLRSCGILLDNLTMAHPKVWHSVTGACFARRELGIQDEEILSAVRYHTTGRAAMPLGETVLYLADLTSADRTFPDVEHVRALSEHSPEEAVWYCQQTIMNMLVQEGRLILPDAWEAYNYYGSICAAGQPAGNKNREGIGYDVVGSGQSHRAPAR